MRENKIWGNRVERRSQGWNENFIRESEEIDGDGEIGWGIWGLAV